MNRKLRLITGIVLALFALGLGQGAANAAPTSTERPAPAAGAASLYGCPYNAFCMYENPDFTGAMILLYGCTAYSFYPTYGMSYVNNERPGTVATFRDARGNVLKISVPPDSGLVPVATRSVVTC
jgi:hypothetical protein